MKKFKFRLEKVLQYRVLVKDEKRRALLKKNRELQDARDHLYWLQEAERQNRLPENVIVPLEEVLLRGLFAERLQQEIVNQRLNIITIEEQVAQAMAEYTQAAREAKALELLKERKQQEYFEYVLKEDEKFLDELAVQRGNQTFKQLADR
jgi:flagellar protein FliJ